ncbi:hypothetical protein HYU23_01960 [Candidatus Woesearchaeota archaeon]|nr:hypothetical protein [Candidatus Woesearchaeota archaeon]
MRRITKRQLAVPIIRKALSKGVNSLEELCFRTRLKPSGLMKVCEIHHIHIPEDLEPYRGLNSDADSCIDGGLSLRNIGLICQTSRQSVLNYIRYTGQYNQWVENRKILDEVSRPLENNNRLYSSRSVVSALITCLRQIALEKARKEGNIAREKAMQYILTKRTNFSYSRLYNIFEQYYFALKKGRKIGLEKLAKDNGMFPASIGRILKCVGLEPLNGSRKRVVTPVYKKEAVYRGFDLDIPPIDIAYFLGLREYVVNVLFIRIKGKRKVTRDFIASFSGKRLSYRMASQIYQDSDMGNRRKYTITKLGINGDMYEYALEHRRRIEPKIVKALRVLYLDKTIDRSYV